MLPLISHPLGQIPTYSSSHSFFTLTIFTISTSTCFNHYFYRCVQRTVPKRTPQYPQKCNSCSWYSPFLFVENWSCSVIWFGIKIWCSTIACFVYFDFDRFYCNGTEHWVRKRVIFFLVFLQVRGKKCLVIDPKLGDSLSLIIQTSVLKALFLPLVTCWDLCIGISIHE